MPAQPSISRDPALETRVFLEQHKSLIIVALLLAILVIGGYTGFRFYSEHRTTEAALALANAKTVQEYQAVIDHYPGTAACADAYLLMAENQRSDKKFADANTTLRAFLNRFPKHDFATTAWMGIAANLESLGKPDEALSTYQRLVTEYPQDFNAPLALISQVHLLKARNKIDEARRVCETVLTQYRESLLSSEASRQLRSLKKSGDTSPVAPGSMTAPIPAGSVSSPARP
jgi:predicted negative regulator of RcsB-dependent stress response